MVLSAKFVLDEQDDAQSDAGPGENEDAGNSTTSLAAPFTFSCREYDSLGFLKREQKSTSRASPASRRTDAARQSRLKTSCK